MHKKLPNTFREIVGHQYRGESITQDCVLLVDHFPYYEIDYNQSRAALCKKHYGQNMLVDNCIDPDSTTWIYDSYMYVDTTKNNIYIPSFTLNIDGYENSDPAKLDRKYKFICLNNKPRLHRILASSWIHKNFTPDEYYYTANFNIKEDGISEHLNFVDAIGPGLPRKVKNLIVGAAGAATATASIFKDTFYPFASDSVFSIVNEVSFFEHACHLSEKTLWAILGYNIPIVSGYAMATYMERIGFDMFTDIVDYSSEFIKDPFLRTQRLLNDNLEVLKNAHDVLTPEILERLEHNSSFLQRTDINKQCTTLLNSSKMLAKLDEIMYNNEYMQSYQGYR